MYYSHTSSPDYRIGLIVPSSNTTMETEMPELLRRHSQNDQVNFTFHSSRMRLKEVSPEALRKMNLEATRCVKELTDAGVDAIIYACLVAVMIDGRKGIEETDQRLTLAATQAVSSPNCISSAAALIQGIKSLGAQKISLIAPYKKSLTRTVCQTIEAYDIEVVSSHSLEVTDNYAVGQLDPKNLIEIASEMDLSNSDALVLSACVQMPSLAVIEEVENMLGIPVISAATTGAFSVLQSLNLTPAIHQAGSLLNKSFSPTI